MNVPTNLKHKPIIIVNDYNEIDSYDPDSTDAKAISLGYAQWDNNDNIAGKIWRHTGKRWSRQSEELPLNRILDLAILICKTKEFYMNSYKDSSDRLVIGEFGIPPRKNKNKLPITRNYELEKDAKTSFVSFFVENEDTLDSRFKELVGLLHKIGY